MKRVMMVEQYGRKLVVEYHPGKDYEYREYDVTNPYRKYHLYSFESFQEAAEDVLYRLYNE